ncbi:hypothetical protein [Legionella rowbothamii]|uniref:hypothetical protein n=1 Tax=Legionella rowbothamii TaxID=96229 RepID=UPI001056714A|nr:hypothetical protein [Legionella rowbothamii]
MPQLNNLFDQANNPEIQKLIDKFNEIPKENYLERCFYLQKINFLLKHTQADAELTRWINASSNEEGSWQALLMSLEINPLAESLLQTTQFADVVANSTEQRPTARKEESAQKLTEALNQLLKQNLPFERCRTQFLELNYRISQIFAKLDPYPQYGRGPLKTFIEQFNALPQDDHIQRIFQLQRIQYQLNKVPLNENLFNWRNGHPDRTGSWESLLTTYGIEPDGSFFLKSAQFAKAIKSRMRSYPPLVKDAAYNDLHKLMQKRDELLEKTVLGAEDRTLYIALSCRIDYLMENEPKYKVTKTRHLLDLTRAKAKLSAIKGHNQEESENYQTAVLGDHQANNFNFTLDIKVLQEEFAKEESKKEESKRFVLRIEDRPQLGIEQKLQSYEVTDYFADDVAFSMIQFKDGDGDVCYKPLVLSQFAKEGDLRSVAKRLRDKNTAFILSSAKHYFERINNFCLKLKEADVYHPDIKLSNFLAHNNRLLVADRKTFVSGQSQLASNLRSSPQYAPPQYTDCLNEDQDAYVAKAYRTRFDMEQFMAYQVGMALKEFLLLTKMDDLPDDYWNPDCDIESYFKDGNNQIKNYILLIREMTRHEEGKRLSISQMQQLLTIIGKQPINFYEDVEKMLPSASVGLEKEYNEIQALLNSNLRNEELLKQANPLFIQLSTRDPQECRLNRLAEKLAVKCYQQCSKSYFTNLSKSIEKSLLDQDWQHASFTQKLIHYVSFGYFRVPEITNVTQIKIALDFSGPEFQSHFIPFISLSKTHLFHLGAKQSQHVIDFLQANMTEIKTALATLFSEDSNEVESTPNEPLQQQVASLSSEESDSELTEESLGDESLSSSIVIHKTTKMDGDKESQAASVIIKSSAETNDEDGEEEENSGSVVFIPNPSSDTTPEAETDAEEEKIEHQEKAKSTLQFFAAVKKQEPSSYQARKKNRFFNRATLRGTSIVFKGEALNSLMAAVAAQEIESTNPSAQNSLAAVC